jgi:hypothetical protein
LPEGGQDFLTVQDRTIAAKILKAKKVQETSATVLEKT